MDNNFLQDTHFNSSVVLVEYMKWVVHEKKMSKVSYSCRDRSKFDFVHVFKFKYCKVWFHLNLCFDYSDSTQPDLLPVLHQSARTVDNSRLSQAGALPEGVPCRAGQPLPGMDRLLGTVAMAGSPSGADDSRVSDCGDVCGSSCRRLRQRGIP